MKKIFSKQVVCYSIIIAITSFFICLGFICNELAFGNAFKLIAFQIFFIIVPGTALLLLLNLGLKDFNFFFAVSYALGYVLNIIIYFFCRLIAWMDGILLIYVLVSALSIAVIVRKQQMIREQKVVIRDFGICTFFLLILCSILFFSYCCNNLLPIAANGNDYYNDNLYWIGNSIELALEFPPMDFRNSTNPFHYHYFSSIQMAVVALLTKGSAVEIGFAYSYVQSAVLLAFSCFCFIRAFVKRSYVTAIALVILYLSAGKTSTTWVTFGGHIYQSSFGMDIALAFSMLTFYVFSRQLTENFQWRTLFISCLFFICALGCKGPVGAVLLCSLGILCFFWLFKERDWKKSIIFGVSLLVLFAVIYTVFLSGVGAQTLTVGSEDSRQLSIIQIPQITPVYNAILGWRVNVPVFIKEIIFMGYYCWKSHMPLFYMFAIVLAFKAVLVRKITIVEGSCIFAGVCGTVCTRIFKHFGYSQMYFLMAAYPFFLLAASIAWDQVLEKIKTGTGKPVKASLLIAFEIGIIIISSNNIYTNVFVASEEMGYGNCLKNGYLKITGQAVDVIYANTYVSPADYEAYQWIRKNTDEMSLCVNSRYAVDSYNRPPLAEGAFTERHMYTANIELIKSCMQNDTAAIDELCKRGVSYIIQAKQIFPDFHCPGGEKVYDGETVAVYDIRDCG